jgi:arylsulfatase A-like enzyme
MKISPRVALFALLLSVLPHFRAHCAVPQTHPNILVILCDDLGLGDYSAFGTKDVRTPHIDSLFKEGMTFRNFRANSCVCSPTRAALLTGCYPDRVGVPGVIREEEPANSWGYLSPSATLLPQVLKQAGYHSAIVGKWHLGISSPNTPLERGFDFFHGFLGDMMDDYWTHLRHGQNFMRKGMKEVTPEGHATDLFSQWACDYLAERAAFKAPFFLYLAYNAPHDPVQPPGTWLEKVKQREPALDEKRAKLVALIEHLDDGIGKVLARLDELNLRENTLVIFTSDNGGLLSSGANNGPWRSGKTHMYEGGLRVPCAARWPARIRAGSSTERQAMSMDIFAAACEAAGESAPKNIDGITFLPTLLGEMQPEPERSHYFIRREGGPQYGGKTIDAIIKGEWKLLQDSPFGAQELYNLKNDPQETTDLAAKEKAVAQELNALLRKQVQRGGIVGWQRPELSK